MIKNLLAFSILLFISSFSTDKSTDQIEVADKEKLNTLEAQAQKLSIQVIDTDFSKGRLTNEQNITLWDNQKLHGHLCDGLVVGFLGLREGLYQLYPDSIIDRTNTRIAAKSSPCICDVGLYLTGGRYQFNSFYVDNAINGIYVVQRIDNNKTVVITMKKDVKPTAIDELGAKAIQQELDACSIDSLKIMEDNFSQLLITGNPIDFFEIAEIDSFTWNPTLSNDFIKTDILNKDLEVCD
jgi:acetolactate decarboxylase